MSHRIMSCHVMSGEVESCHVASYRIMSCHVCHTPNLPTNIVDFGGFDSSIMLCLRVEFSCPGDFPDSLSQAMLVGTMLVGRLGVMQCHVCVIS